MQSYQKKIKIILGVILLILILLAWFLKRQGCLAPEYLQLIFTQDKKVAPVLFIIIHTLAPALFIPCLPLTILSGFLWGKFYGSIFAILGAACGSGFTFMLARYLGQDFFRNRFNNKTMNWLRHNVDKNGWKIIAFTQINPIFPASSLGYLYGLTNIPYWLYLATTLIFMLPLVILLVTFGDSMHDVLLLNDTKRLIISFLFMGVSFIIIFCLKPITKKLVKGRAEENE